MQVTAGFAKAGARATRPSLRCDGRSSYIHSAMTGNIEFTARDNSLHGEV